MSLLNKFINILIGGSTEIDFIENTSPEKFLEKVGELGKKEIEKNIFAILNYQNPIVKKAVKILKYHGNTYSAKIFGEILASEISGFLEEEGALLNLKKPILCPVPISKKRMEERGFNQTEIICKEILKAGLSGFVDFRPQLLIKTKDVESQVKTKNRARRLENLKGCFSVNEKSLIGKNIIVIDDVITTGGTAHEIIKTLKEAGAKRVFFFGVAH